MSASTIASLLLPVSPITPEHTVSDVGDALLSEEYANLLSLPVVEDGRPVGIVSRYSLMRVFLHRFGRDIHGRKPVAQFMNPAPLVVDAGLDTDAAAQYLAANMRLPLTEDFIVVRDGKYLGVGIVLDLLRAMEARAAQRNTELSKAYGELQASQTRLVQSEKMASLGQMVAGVAHEINTPLGYVRGNVETLEGVYARAFEALSGFDDLVGLMIAGDVDEAALNAQLQAAVDMAAAVRESAPPEEIAGVFRDTVYGIEAIGELVTNLRNFSRLDQARTARIDLNECLDSALNIAGHAIKNRAQLVKRYGEVAKLACSPSQLNQVFLNIITNAAQAMDKPGYIVVETRAEGPEAVVVITDNGRGIPAEVLPRIFDPFFTTKPVGEGTGLGLSICFQIVEQHGGTIKAESTVGKGTRFTIRLPFEQRAAAANDAAAAA